MKPTFLRPHKLWLLLLLFLSACAPQEQFHYEKRQAVLIKSLREQMYYEYSSPLNEAMKIYLELELANHPDIKLPLDKIYYIEKKVKKEKPLLGCYYMKTARFEADKKLYIILDWNNTNGVIIRFFTNSNLIINNLPDYSF